MVLWGAILGGVLGLLLGGRPSLSLALLAAAVGMAFGAMLRRAVRAEVSAMLAAAQQRPAAESTRVQDAVAARTVAAPAPEPALPPVRPLPAPVTTAASAQPAPVLSHEAFAATPALAADDNQAVSVGADSDAAELLLARVRQWVLGGNTVVRMGVLVLFVGLAFLAKYAIDNSLLPPEVRLAGIGAAGIALFGAGFHLQRRRADRLVYALTLEGAGVAVLYLTIFSAFRLYHFLSPGAAFAALGVVCALSAFIAVVQNAPSMAFVAFAGAFAAPILVSTGSGNHVALFSYYLLLGVAIAALAAVKAWRPLNLLGFFATFGIATAWGVLQYRPAQFATTEPFLIAFFAVYLAASVLYALRHSLAPRHAVDATLIFATPLVAFGLQSRLVHEIEYGAAGSSLALGACYVVLAWAMLRASPAADGQRQQVRRWLAECFVALGFGFTTLAVPLAFDGGWTAAVWAIEGAGVFWIGRRQGRWLARASGLALQLLAALAYLGADAGRLASPWPLANVHFMGAAMLAGAAFAIAAWSREPGTVVEGAGARVAFEHAEQQLSPVLFWIGFVWWQYALRGEIRRAPLNLYGMPAPIFQPLEQLHLQLIAWVASAFAVHFLALPARRRPWPVAATPAATVLPVMLSIAVAGIQEFGTVFESWGWLAWTVALALHYTMLRRLDAAAPQGWWSWVHSGGVWLLVLLGGSAIARAVSQAGLLHTDWAAVIALVAGTVVLLWLSRAAWFEAPARATWPLDRFADAYLWRAAAPLAAYVAAGTVFAALACAGETRPLPYLPLLNPAEVAIALGLASVTLWLNRIRACTLDVPPWSRDRRWLLAPAGIAFLAVNTVWLRMAHHYAGVAWNAHALFDSFLVQAGYSVLWTLVALVLMVAANRRGWRAPWLAGAGLLGITVLKLFVIDLSNRGGAERIVAFIVVGLLMLVVGYFAPVPPGARREPEQALKEMAT